VRTEYRTFCGKFLLATIQDACPALLKALKEVYPFSIIYICGWHLQLNLKEYFVRLKRTLGKKVHFEEPYLIFLELDTELYDRILALPFIPSKEKYDGILREVENSPNIKKKNKTYLRKSFLLN